MIQSKRYFELPPRLSESLALTAALQRFPQIFMPTFRAAISRFGAFPDLGDWIDMKFDPRTGVERGGESGPYARRVVYGWIQGRALEAMSAFIRWRESSPERASPDAARVAESLYAGIIRSCFPGRDGHLRGGFAMDPAGTRLGEAPFDATGAGWSATLTSLFLLRGLISYAPLSRQEEDSGWIVSALRDAIDAALRGECLNDQLSYGASGGGVSQKDIEARLRGYEGRMIALGACRLLYERTRDSADRSRGIRLVSSVLEGHFFRNSAGRAWLSDLPVGRREGVPEFGSIQGPESRRTWAVNPGHIIEFAGLALQFHRVAGGIEEDDLAHVGELATTSWRLGRAPFGGIVRGMDGRDGSILDPHCPWWSSFESIRTFAELYLQSEDAQARSGCVETIKSCLECIESAYLGQSKTGIPVQTLSLEGRVEDFIPATPDLDPGYHTGMPLMDAELALRGIKTMLAGAGETIIPARPGFLLQGHIARYQPADVELDPLRASAVVMEAQGSPCALISADVLEFSSEWAGETCRELSSVSGIPEERIFLAATHTHTAPCSIRLGTRPENTTFLDGLRKALLEALRAAMSSMRPAVGWLGSVEVDSLGINRRGLDPDTGRAVMRPNPSGDRDREIGCLYLIDGQRTPFGVLLNPVVHPTALGVGTCAISADYPGRIAATMKRNYGENLVVLTIQGACGDVRPAILDPTGRDFVDGKPADIERMGREAAEAIIRQAHGATQGSGRGFSWLDVAFVRCTSKTVDLPYSPPKSKEEIVAFRAKMQGMLDWKATAETAKGFSAAHDNPALGAESLAAWADRMLETAFDGEGNYRGPASEPARFGFCELAGRDGLSLQIFTLPGEAFSRTGLELKAEAAPSRLFVCGYCGGTVGYIPTAESFARGGYEVEQAFMYYGRPSALSPSAESMVHAIYKLLREKAR
ncbi:MAG TPA: AGE family epimerase/isomerase [Rectinemataceae bacterium]